MQIEQHFWIEFNLFIWSLSSELVLLNLNIFNKGGGKSSMALQTVIWGEGKLRKEVVGVGRHFFAFDDELEATGISLGDSVTVAGVVDDSGQGEAT